MTNKDPYAGMPWTGLDQYYDLGKKYGLWGMELKKYMEKLNKQTRIPEPVIRRKK